MDFLHARIVPPSSLSRLCRLHILAPQTRYRSVRPEIRHPHLYASFLGYNCDLVLDYCSTLRCRSLRLLSQTSVHFALRYFGVPFALLTSAYAKSASRRRGVICSLFPLLRDGYWGYKIYLGQQCPHATQNKRLR